MLYHCKSPHKDLHTRGSRAAQLGYVMPRPTVRQTHRPDQWHIAANLIDKAYNLREPLNHTPHMHKQTHTATGHCQIQPGGLGTKL